MRPADVYELTSVGDPRISVDGTRVAYVVTSVDQASSDYRSAIWIVPFDDPGEAYRFTAGARRDAEPRWSPDGRWLAFTSTRGPDRTPSNLYIIPADGGEARQLTDLKEAVESVAWSPDSSSLAFSMRDRDPAYQEEDERRRAPRRFRRVFHKLDSVGWTGDRRKHLFVVDLDGGEPRRVTGGDFEDGPAAWTPDGKRLVFTALRDVDWDTLLVSRVYVVDARGGEPELLTEEDGSFEAVAPSPDGTRLAFRYLVEDGTFPRHSQVGVMDIDGGNRRLLTGSLDRQCGPYPEIREPLWEGERIIFAVEDRGNVHLYGVGADGSSEPELLVGGEQTVTGYDLRNGRIVYTASTHTTMSELYVGPEGRRATGVGRAFVEGRELVEPERYTAVSGDGYEVDAWVVRPAGLEPGRRYPTLLSIHGGPFAQYETGFFDEFQVYSGAGYAVLFANPRGGSGYSEAHGRAIRGPLGGAGPGWGVLDYEDLMAVVDQALERFDFVDPERLGVIGGSYGGYMTSWIIGHTTRFKAAVSERAVNNLVSMFGSSDIFWAFEKQFGGPMWENLESQIEKSPSTYARDIQTPLLVLHSEQDLRCSIEQGEYLFTLLRLLGKDVEFVRFPGESHELSRAGSPAHRVMRFEAILEWFGRYLTPA